MTISRDDALALVIQTLGEVQRDIVDGSEEINAQTRPIGDLQDFDSLTSVCATILCLEKLGISDPLEFPSLFIDKGGNALTVDEVADRIVKSLKRH